MAYLTLGALFLAIFDFGSAVMCYECNSAIHTQCEGSRLPDSLLRNCTELDRGVKHTLCRKIVQHVDYGAVDGRLPANRVVRTCGWDDSKYKGSCYHRSGFGGRHEVCSCTKDYCNGSYDVRGTALPVLASAFMMLRTIACH